VEATEQRAVAGRNGGDAFLLHEYVSLYKEASLSVLMEAVGLNMLKMESAARDMGWRHIAVLSAAISRLGDS
jgi:hypothetical protein